MLGLSAEFLLTAACCRWPASPERDAAVRARARTVDWQRFLAVVRRQRVEGLAHAALASADVAPAPEVQRELAAAAAQTARQNLGFAAESVRLQRLFTAAGTGIVFVKGIPLSLLAYGTLAVKKSWDIDMAVPPEAVSQASRIMTEAGYRRVVPTEELPDSRFDIWIDLCKESIWRHGKSGIVVEMHSGLVDNPMLLRGVDARSPQQLVPLGSGASLPTLRKDELFSYVCVHGATHAWSRLKWIADVAALIKDDDDAELERLYRASLAIGVGRCSAQALLLCAQLFDRRLPSGLEAELRGDRANLWLARVALRSMAGAHEAVELDDKILGTVPIHLSHFALARGWRYKAAEVRRKALSPHDRAMLPLPRALHFLYPLLLVPRWLWRRARGPAAT